MYRPTSTRRPAPMSPYRPPARRPMVGYAAVGRSHNAYHEILQGIASARRDQDVLPFWLDAKELHAKRQLSEQEFTQIRLSAEYVLMEMAGREPSFEMPEGLRSVGHSVSGVRRRASVRGAGVGRAPARKPAKRKSVKKGVKKAAPKRKAPKRAAAKKAPSKTKACPGCGSRGAKSAAYCAKCGCPVKSSTVRKAPARRPAPARSYRSPLQLDSRIHEVPAPARRR